MAIIIKHSMTKNLKTSAMDCLKVVRCYTCTSLDHDEVKARLGGTCRVRLHLRIP